MKCDCKVVGNDHDEWCSSHPNKVIEELEYAIQSWKAEEESWAEIDKARFERIKQLENENLVLMNAIQQLDAGILPDGSHVDGAVVLFAESILEKVEKLK